MRLRVSDGLTDDSIRGDRVRGKRVGRAGWARPKSHCCGWMGGLEWGLGLLCHFARSNDRGVIDAEPSLVGGPPGPDAGWKRPQHSTRACRFVHSPAADGSSGSGVEGRHGEPHRETTTPNYDALEALDGGAGRDPVILIPDVAFEFSQIHKILIEPRARSRRRCG